jgi:hypothetical protein
LLKNHLMARDLKYLSLGVGFLAAMLVFSMAAATGAIIIAPPALAQTDGSSGSSLSIRGGGSAGDGGSGSVSTTITDAQIRLAQAMTALQNKNTTGAMMQLKLLNQSLSTLSTGVGGMATSGVNPGPGPSTGIAGPGPSGGVGAGSSGPGIPGGGGPGAGSSGPGR